MPKKRVLASAITAVLAAVLAFAAMPATPASAVYQYKYGKCGAFKSGVRGFLALTYSYKVKQNTWDVTGTVTDRKSSINTYGCTDGKNKTINTVRVKSTVRFGGVSISDCSVGSGGGSCTVKSTAASYSSGWKTAGNKSYMTHTVTKVVASANVHLHSLTNRIDGNWVSGSNDYDDYFDYYCDGTNGRSSCSKRNG
jgi:hypothetical protein